MIAAIKTGSIILGYITRKQFTAMHTMMNKATGLLLFLWPLTIPLAESTCIAIAVCAIATFAAIQEGICVVKGCSPE